MWDYEHNSTAALSQLFHEFRLEDFGFSSKEKFIEAFHRANLKVWDIFDESILNRHTLRHKRMELVFEEFGLPPREIENFNERYYGTCSTGKKVVEGCFETLDTLNPHFSLHIITNGFNDALQNKLKFSGLDKYFETITSSETAGFKKPDGGYFSFALNKAGAKKGNSLVIGDGLRTDVAGAIQFGLPVIWFNPERKINPHKNLIEIQSLFELPALLLNSEKHNPPKEVFT